MLKLYNSPNKFTGGNYSDVLKQATLKVISNCECNTTVNVNHPYPTEIVDHMLCAISPGQDSCQVPTHLLICIVVSENRNIYLSF